MLKKYSLLTLALIFLISACGPKSVAPPPATPLVDPKNDPQSTEYTKPLPTQLAFPKNAERITVMTYNVGNLFDTENDPDLQGDDTYLPLDVKATLPDHHKKCETNEFGQKQPTSWANSCKFLDWTLPALTEKSKRIADVIRATNKGKGADIIVFQEVENIKVIENMNAAFLSDLGYAVNLIEDDSSYRGIDIAMLSRIPLLAKPKLKSLLRKNRKALYAQFDLGDNHKLTLYGVHFVASAYKSAQVRRIKMLEELRKLMSKDSKELTVVAGDLNIPKKFLVEDKVINKNMRPEFTPVHLFCKACKGTKYFSDWSFLDMILASENLFKAGSLWTIDQTSADVHAPLAIQLTQDGRPKKFKFGTDFGVSDHLPLIVDLVKTK